MKHRTRASLALICTVAAAVLALGGPAHAAVPPVVIDRLEPLQGNSLRVARTAARTAGLTDQWKLKGDVWFDNTSASDLHAYQVTMSYPGNAPVSATSAVDVTIEAGKTLHVTFSDGITRDLILPLPASVTVSVYFDGFRQPFSFTRGLVLHENDTPLGSYFFPAKASDLPAGQYWSYGTRHVDQHTREQRYAYDMGVVRWDGAQWTSLKPGAPADPDDRVNSDYLVFGKPLYSMADGVIRICKRTVAENPLGVKGSGAGNYFYIQHGDEYSLYAHFKQFSIPAALCPQEGVWGVDVPVKAGQYLGDAGNTGQSTGPHLHLHTQAVSPNESDYDTGNGLPLLFHNIRVASHAIDVDNFGANPPLYARSTGAILNSRSLISPNPCGWNVPNPGAIEVARHGIPANCYQDVFNQIVYAGYRPVFVDGFDVAGSNYFNAIFRPGAGIPWVARHGMTGASYQDEFDKWTGLDYRLHQVEAYRVGHSIRYAAIWEKRSGPQFTAYHGKTAAEHQLLFNSLANQGWVAINVAPVSAGGQLYYAALYEKMAVSAWVLKSATPEAQYQAEFDANVDAGRLPVYVNAFNHNGAPYISAIWLNPIGGSWAARHGRTSAEYQADWNSFTGQGLLTRAVAGYERPNEGARYVAVWRVRPNTTITAGPAQITASTSASLSFTGNVPNARFECRIDGGAYSECSSPKQYVQLAAGSHTFHVRALDRESVTDPTPATRSWLVDTSPPVIDLFRPATGSQYVQDVEIKTGQAQTTAVGSLTVRATATDAESGITGLTFKVDNVPVPANQVSYDAATKTWSFVYSPTPPPAIRTVTAQATNGTGATASDSAQFLSLGA